jgi:uncharacterized protein YbjT (DUF2867 family)
MKTVVVGGTGLIGSRLVKRLRELGNEVVAAAPNNGVNSITGEGLEGAMRGAAVVVDVTNSPSWEDAAVLKFFETSTRNLLAFATAAGVKHYIALSVVGTERLLDSGFFRAKLAQERLIQASSIPYTIVRATQFFEFVKAIADYSTKTTKFACLPCCSSRWPPMMLPLRSPKLPPLRRSMAWSKSEGRRNFDSMKSSSGV